MKGESFGAIMDVLCKPFRTIIEGIAINLINTCIRLAKILLSSMIKKVMNKTRRHWHSLKAQPRHQKWERG